MRDKAGDRRQRRVLDHALRVGNRVAVSRQVGLLDSRLIRHTYMPASFWSLDACGVEYEERARVNTGSGDRSSIALSVLRTSCRQRGAAPRRRACCARPFPSSWAKDPSTCGRQAGEMVR